MSKDKLNEFIKMLSSKTIVGTNDSESEERAKYLLDSIIAEGGFNPNLKFEKSNVSMLYYAAKKGYTSIIRTLIENGANVNITTTTGFTALYPATFYGQSAAIRELLTRGANPLLIEGETQTIMHYAVHKHNLEILHIINESCPTLSQVKNKFGENPFHIAIKISSIEIVKYFIDSNISIINIPDNNGDVPLLIAVKCGRVDVVELIMEESKKHADYSSLVYKPFEDMNKTNNNFENALHLAVIYNQKEIAKLILSSLTIANGKNKDGKTPLHLAVEQGKIDMVNLILDSYPAIVNDVEKLSANNMLHIAVKQGNLEMVNCLMDRGININRVNEKGLSPLMLACQAKNFEIVESILKSNIINPRQFQSAIILAGEEKRIVDLINKKNLEILKINSLIFESIADGVAGAELGAGSAAHAQGSEEHDQDGARKRQRC